MFTRICYHILVQMFGSLRSKKNSHMCTMEKSEKETNKKIYLLKIFSLFADSRILFFLLLVSLLLLLRRAAANKLKNIVLFYPLKFKNTPMTKKYKNKLFRIFFDNKTSFMFFSDNNNFFFVFVHDGFSNVIIFPFRRRDCSKEKKRFIDLRGKINFNVVVFFFFLLLC
jgi:hypothetical protein